MCEELESWNKKLAKHPKTLRIKLAYPCRVCNKNCKECLAQL